MYKYSIITTIFNNEPILEIENQLEDVEYVIVTNDENLKSKTWKILLFDKYDEIEDNDFAESYVQLFPFKFCSSNLCLYIANCIKIEDDFSKMIEYFEDNHLEYAITVNQGYKTIADLTNNDSNFNAYLNEYAVNSLFVYRKNNQFTNKIGRQAFEFFKNCNYQNKMEISLTCSLYNCAYYSTKIGIVDQNILFSPWFKWYNNNIYNYQFYCQDNGTNYFYCNSKVVFQNQIIAPISYQKIIDNQPLLTIVITCYNKQNTIERAINSVKQISYKNWECIVVNNGSTDNSLNCILNCVKNDKRFKVITQPNKNVCSSRNVGAFAGNGKYLTFVDGDDEIGKNFCERAIQDMEKNKKSCIGSGLFLRKYLNNEEQYFLLPCSYFNCFPTQERIKYNLTVNQFPVTSILRMNRFKKIGGFKIGVEYTQEDWEMFNRYLYADLNNLDITFIYDEVTVIMYMQNDSKTMVQNKNWGNIYKERLDMYNENPIIYEYFFTKNEIENIKNQKDI